MWLSFFPQIVRATGSNVPWFILYFSQCKYFRQTLRIRIFETCGCPSSSKPLELCFKVTVALLPNNVCRTPVSGLYLLSGEIHACAGSGTLMCALLISLRAFVTVTAYILLCVFSPEDLWYPPLMCTKVGFAFAWICHSEFPYRKCRAMLLHTQKGPCFALKKTGNYSDLLFG